MERFGGEDEIGGEVMKFVESDSDVLVFRDPIEGVLRGEAAAIYRRRLPLKTRKGLVNGLMETPRWQNNGLEINPNWRENNLEHVVELIAWANEIEDDFPELWWEVSDGLVENWRKLLAMLIQHDIGEIIVGDLSRSHPDFHKKIGRHHKRKEAYAAYLLLGKHLPEWKVEEGRELYHRFDQRRPEDKLVMLGHVLDKGQAAQQIPYHVLPFNLENKDYDLRSRIIVAQSDVLDYAEKLMLGLQSPKAKEQLREFLVRKIVGHFDRLKVSDVEEIQREVRGKFPAVFEL